MKAAGAVVVVLVLLSLLMLAMAVRIVKQYENGVLFRLGRVIGERQPGLRLIIPFIDVLHRISLRIVTMPIQSQGIITRDNVSVDVSAVAYFKVVDAVKSVVAIENVYSAIDQIAQTTLRKVVGQHTLDETLSETDKINLDIRAILDVTTIEWGVQVTLVELKDIQLPDSMKRAMARQAEAEREKRAKIIAADPGRTRRRQEHHRRVPGTVDVDHRRTRNLPGPGKRRSSPARASDHRPETDCGGSEWGLARGEPAMIAALIFMSLSGWGFWLMYRDVRYPRVTTPVAVPEQRATRAAAVLGLEDDPNQWRAARGWTALDEHQLIRLLTDSAP
jgi:hypothetical protein